MAFDISGGHAASSYEFYDNVFAPAKITDFLRRPNPVDGQLQIGYINGGNAAIVFEDNEFIVPPRRMTGGLVPGEVSTPYPRPLSAIWAGSTAPTTIRNNVFSFRSEGFDDLPGNTYLEEFNYIYVDTITSSVGVSISNKTITIEGNTFSSPPNPGTNQTAIELYRTQGNNSVPATYLDGGVIIGDGNIFEDGLEFYIRMDDGTGAYPSMAKPTHGPSDPFNVNVDQAYENYYSVGGVPKLVSEMTPAERAELESKLYHAPDNASLGYIYLDGTGILNVSDTFPLPNAVAAARPGDTVTLPANGVTNAFNVLIDKAISLVGNNSQLVGNGSSAALIAPNNGPSFSISGIHFVNHGSALNVQSTATPRTVTVTDSAFGPVGAAVTVGSGNTVNVTGNVFFSASQAFFTPVAQFAGLNVNHNVFFNSNLYFINSGNFSSPAPNFDNNWFADEFDIDGDSTGYITGLVKTVSTNASNQVVTATNVVAQFDRDGDGIPDVFELAPGSTTEYDNLATDSGTGLPDGVATGTDLNEDSNDSGYADWYEINLGFIPPTLGDVTESGSVTLGDAVRALQIVNGGTVPGSLNNLNVTGNVNSVYSITNPLQILRFQAGVRQSLPAVPGVQ